jgi:hypothetical protein
MGKKNFDNVLEDVALNYISEPAKPAEEKKTAKKPVKTKAEPVAPAKVETLTADKDKRGRLNLTVPMGLREDVEKIIKLSKYNSLNALIIDLMTQYRDANTDKLNKVNEWGE